MFPYPAHLTPDDNGTVLVTFPDFPEAATFGDDEGEALLRAVDAIETAINARIRDGEDIPEPSPPRPGVASVALPSIIAAKVMLYRAMRAEGIRKAELARRLHCDFSQVGRLLDVRHNSRLDQVDAALATMGKRLDVRLADAG